MAHDSSTSVTIPPVAQDILKNFVDVFPTELTIKLTPLRDIQHHIDFALGTPLPNRPHYRMSPTKHAELAGKLKTFYRDSPHPSAFIRHLWDTDDGTHVFSHNCLLLNPPLSAPPPSRLAPPPCSYPVRRLWPFPGRESSDREGRLGSVCSPYSWASPTSSPHAPTFLLTFHVDESFFFPRLYPW